MSRRVLGLLILSLAMIGANRSSRACVQLPSTSAEIATRLAELWSRDEVIRARAARRLFELGDPHALAANLMTLDDDPDPLHADYTPAVGALGAIGKAALPGLYDRLDAPLELTRRRAWNAVLFATQKAFGWDAMRGWPPDGSEQRYYAWIMSIDYRPDARSAVRRRAVARLRASRLP